MKLSRMTALISLLLCLSLLSACQRSDGGLSASSAGGSGVDLSTPGSPSGSPASDPAPPQAPEPEPEPDSEPDPGPVPDPQPDPEPESPPAQEPEPGSESEPDPGPNQTLYILMYHLFVLDDQPCNEWTVTNGRFREDLQWLADHGYTTVLPRELAVLHTSNVGRVYTYIVRGTAAAVTERMGQFQPLMLEALPLSLEEIFIYELGGEHYAVKELLL